MAWITPPVFVALQTLTDSVMNQLSSRLSDLWVGTTAGDTDYYSASDTKTRLALGSAGQYLGVTGSAPAWKDDGVPGLFTTAGDIPYGTGANASSRLGIGTAGQVLQTNSGATAPEWSGLSYAQLQISADQTIADATYSAISWDVENYDTDSYHEGITNPTRITIPTTGWYLLSAMIPWATNATNLREVLFRLGGTTALAKDSRLAVSGARTNQPLFTPLYLTAATYIEVVVWQNSTASVAVEYDDGATPANKVVAQATIIRLGP